MTPMQWAMKVIHGMQLQGRKCVVVVKRGENYSGRPAAIFEGTREYPQVKQTKRVVVVGYYDPDCLARHLASDVSEFFKGKR